MDRSITTVMTVLEVGVPAVIAWSLYHFGRTYDRVYLRLWSAFWLALSLFHLAGRISFDLLQQAPFTRPDRFLLTSVAVSALFVGIVYFGSGTFAVLYLRPPRRSRIRILTVLAILVGVGATVAMNALWQAGTRLVTYNHIAGISLGIAYIGAATVLGQRRALRDRGSWLILASILAVAGTIEITGALLQASWNELIGTPRVVIEIVVSCALAIGMLIRLLDEERVAALSAADQVAHMVYHEELTGLANRSLLLDRLTIAITQSERRNKLLALIFMDIDGFKPVNDTLGHDAGDELLKEVANRIRSIVRAEDTVARFGGDEFVILITDLRTPEDSGKIGIKLNQIIREPFRIGEHEVSVTTSVGIAIYPEDGTDAETLMRNADQAMYQAKERGGDQFHLYSVRMNHRALEKLELENGLRRALELRQLELHFDPIFHCSTMELLGFEAILRWDHPVRGLLSAEEFMPAAERSSMIVPIGRFAISEACRQLAHWSRQIDEELFVAINISNGELREDDVAAHLAASLGEYHLEPRRIELEIEEASAPTDLSLQETLAGRIRELGVRITIDDFGSGTGSLHQLRTVPVDGVKLSSQLAVRAGDRAGQAISRGIASIARELDLGVGIEGLASSDQLSLVREMGCERLQGPLFTEPIPPEEVIRFIQDHHERRSQTRA